MWAKTGMEQRIKLMCEIKVRPMHLPYLLPCKNVSVVEMEPANLPTSQPAHVLVQFYDFFCHSAAQENTHGEGIKRGES